jgi:hypothetical protein
MAAPTVRIGEASRQVLKELTEQTTGPWTFTAASCSSSR